MVYQQRANSDLVIHFLLRGRVQTGCGNGTGPDLYFCQWRPEVDSFKRAAFSLEFCCAIEGRDDRSGG